MQYLNFPEIELLLEDVKTYHSMSGYIDQTELRKRINQQRLAIALDACRRMCFWDTTNIQLGSANETKDYFFSRGDIKSLIKRGIAVLQQDINVSLVHQGIRRNIFTRQSLAWQQLFSTIQNATESDNGQNLPFDLPAEIYLKENESINIQVTGQEATGFVFWQGCNLVENTVDENDIKTEILSNDLPTSIFVPLVYQFDTADGYAVDGQGNSNIFTNKNNVSCILTHVSVAGDSTSQGLNCKLSLIDVGRNTEFCDLMEMRGVAGGYLNKYTVYYPLPYPIFLPRQDQLKARILNGSDINGERNSTGVTNYLTFAGITL